MTILESINHNHRAELQRLNERISNQLENSNTLMSRIVMSLLRTKGKQIRPLMVMICAGMFGPVDDKVLAAAVAVELLHNASLIHDDVVDNSPTRRNMPTVNAVWDNHIDYKTASLFVASAEMGCLAAGVDDYRLEALSEYALLFGRCFQIRDDIFDYFPAEKVGKPTGNDLREGKMSLPLLYVLNREGLEGVDDIKKMLMSDTLSDAEISHIQAFARDNGGIDYAFDVMERLRKRACECLSKLPQCTGRDELEQLIDFTISRNF